MMNFGQVQVFVSVKLIKWIGKEKRKNESNNCKTINEPVEGIHTRNSLKKDTMRFIKLSGNLPECKCYSFSCFFSANCSRDIKNWWSVFVTDKHDSQGKLQVSRFNIFFVCQSLENRFCR